MSIILYILSNLNFFFLSFQKLVFSLILYLTFPHLPIHFLAFSYHFHSDLLSSTYPSNISTAGTDESYITIFLHASQEPEIPPTSQVLFKTYLANHIPLVYRR